MDPIRLLHIWLERETAVHVNGLELTATALVGHCTVLARLTIVKGGPHPPCSLHVGETQEYDQMEMDVALPCAKRGIFEVYIYLAPDFVHYT